MPDDETVNQMIARSEEEFEQFMVSPSSVPNQVNTLFVNLYSGNTAAFFASSSSAANGSGQAPRGGPQP